MSLAEPGNSQTRSGAWRSGTRRPPLAAVLPLQRAVGRIEARFARRDGGTHLETLHQSGSAKLRMPKRYDGIAEAILINTAGGLTGGDRFGVRLYAQAGTEVVVTTQASEKAYRSLSGSAEVETAITVDGGARFDWLPQETIVYDRAGLKRRYEVDLADSAVFLGVESVVFGRGAMGETVRSGTFHDRWRIRRDHRLIFADDIRFDGAIAELTARSAALDGATAMATLIYCADDGERLIDPLREAVGDAGGASWFGGKLIARLVAADGFALRRRLVPAFAVLRQGKGLPRIWQQ